jgi:hypothetical protein
MSHRPLIYSPRPIKTRTLDAMHRRNLEALKLGFVLSLLQQTIKPFPASDSLRVVGILDLDPGKLGAPETLSRHFPWLQPGIARAAIYTNPRLRRKWHCRSIRTPHSIDPSDRALVRAPTSHGAQNEFPERHLLTFNDHPGFTRRTCVRSARGGPRPFRPACRHKARGQGAGAERDCS